MVFTAKGGRRERLGFDSYALRTIEKLPLLDAIFQRPAHPFRERQTRFRCQLLVTGLLGICEPDRRYSSQYFAFRFRRSADFIRLRPWHFLPH